MLIALHRLIYWFQEEMPRQTTGQEWLCPISYCHSTPHEEPELFQTKSSCFGPSTSEAGRWGLLLTEGLNPQLPEFMLLPSYFSFFLSLSLFLAPRPTKWPLPSYPNSLNCREIYLGLFEPEQMWQSPPMLYTQRYRFNSLLGLPRKKKS